jgi:hypothetical protein
VARWKTISPKKLSARKRRRLEGAEYFGKVSSGHERVAFDRAVDRFIRESSCRHKQSLGSPCVDFDAGAKGVCKRDGRICDILTEKGERYLREYE